MIQNGARYFRWPKENWDEIYETTLCMRLVNTRILETVKLNIHTFFYCTQKHFTSVKYLKGDSEANNMLLVVPLISDDFREQNL